ncbi:MAG TPA: hypothetical protein VKS20_07230 [Candidatus Acidoferrales bacterium]|nr:hypothetical protein [Candidatus Acidoferrales bacterium]
MSHLDVLSYDVTVSIANYLALAVLLFSFQPAAHVTEPPGWPLGHFATLLLCAILISVVFACVFHSSVKERALAAIRYFVILVVVSVAIGWLMLPFSH